MAEAIVSPDGKLQITRHSIVYPTMGPKSVQGALKNLSTAPVSAEIVVEFYDEPGTPLGQSTGVFKDIAPGEIRLFDLWAERLPNMYEVESHKIISLRTIA
ncbi:MAG: hypothetical protein A2144_13220 [Chloroflexi bacterium RBG_16_50_9]|nr:MAG: hypothetical protein A2144_13220 [Chloroflexi bacterium RBG_16_50_9]